MSKEVQEQLSDLEAAVEALKEEVAELKAEIAYLNDDFEDYENDIDVEE